MGADEPTLVDSGTLRRQDLGRLLGTNRALEGKSPTLALLSPSVCHDAKCPGYKNASRIRPYLLCHDGLKTISHKPKEFFPLLTWFRQVLCHINTEVTHSLKMRTSPGVPGKLIYKGVGTSTSSKILHISGPGKHVPQAPFYS